MKNIQSKNAKISVLGTIWLRLIRTSMYNAFRIHVLIVSEQFLSQAESWYEYSRKRKKKAGSFQNFVSKLASDIEADLMSRTPTVDGNSDGDHSDEDGTTGDISGRRNYNTRKQFFVQGSEAWIKRCTNPRDHALILNKVNGASGRIAQLHCIMCCCRVHNGEKHSRKGAKTRYMSNICRVGLCEDGDCFAKFHAAKKECNPCATTPTIVSVATNRSGAVSTLTDTASNNESQPLRGVSAITPRNLREATQQPNLASIASKRKNNIPL
jgi:hypothetical protein